MLALLIVLTLVHHQRQLSILAELERRLTVRLIARAQELRRADLVAERAEIGALVSITAHCRVVLGAPGLLALSHIGETTALVDLLVGAENGSVVIGSLGSAARVPPTEEVGAGGRPVVDQVACVVLVNAILKRGHVDVSFISLPSVLPL